MIEKDIFTVSEEEAGKRLDQLLYQHYQGEPSRSYFQHLIVEKKVLVNGVAVKKRQTPSLGDQIEVEFSYAPEMTIEPEEIPLSILYEDKDLLVVNKPAGMVVHPAPGNWTGTFVHALLYHTNKSAREEQDHRPGIVHRLDKDTSGCLVAAKNLFTQKMLSEQFKERKTEKDYIAVTVGVPKEGVCKGRIARHPVHRKQMSVVEDKGREAISSIQVLAHNEKFAVVKIALFTGRTHQARVHLQHLGAPILGDQVYGRKGVNQQMQVPRQQLHAYRLAFFHPITGEKIEVFAPLAQDMQKYVAKISHELSF